MNGQSLKRNIRDLVLGGFYAGRPTFITRRVLAGLYGSPGDWHVRLTNVDRKRKPTEIEDLTDRLGRAVRD